MIRINLLSQDRERSKRRQASTPVAFQSGQKIAVACTLILALTAIGVAWWYWSLRKDATRLTDEIASAQQETARLQSLIAQVNQFEERKAQLQQRVTLIEQLRSGQSGPVHLLDEVSRAVPEMLWLTQMELKGPELLLEGRCSSLTSLSDFVDNLARSGWFKRPVEITESQVESGAGGGAELVRFSVKAQFAPPAGG